MELISVYAMVLSGINTLFWLFPLETSKRFTRIFNIVFVGLIAISLFTPSIISTHFVVPFQLASLISIVYCNLVLFKAILRKREGAIIIGLGFALMSVIFILSVPYYNQLTNFSINMYTAYAFIFAFIQVLLLAKMFSSALTRAENFAGELEKTVEMRTNELVKAQEELITVARNAENEKIRRRISQDIHDDISSGLNKISWLSELVKIKAETITLDFHLEGTSYFFTISDDGTGFEEGVIKGTGNGMNNMQKRMVAVHGKFILDTKPGQGTKIMLEGILY